MTEPTLRELCVRVIEAACPTTAGGTRQRRFMKAKNALYAAVGTVYSAALPNPEDGARAILAALDAEREAGRARGFVDALSEVTLGSQASRPPEGLVGALHDRIHCESGSMRAAKSDV